MMMTEFIEDFKAYLNSIGFSYDDEDFKEAESEIKREIKRELVSSIWERTGIFDMEYRRRDKSLPVRG